MKAARIWYDHVQHAPAPDVEALLHFLRETGCNPVVEQMSIRINLQATPAACSPIIVGS